MKKLIIAVLAFALCASAVVTALAADYSFETGTDTLGGFGGATGYDAPVAPDPMSENVRRNKDAAYLPPPYFYGSGDIPTDPSSLYHDNNRESGFAPGSQDLPLYGGEGYAPGSSGVFVNWLPSTSQTVSQNTAPQYYPDGSIGTLYVARTGKTIKVWEGESTENMSRGAGHFTSTSTWDGNCALAGHNRGSSAYFSFVKDAQIGDSLTYTTLYGSRTYEVYSKTQISELDSSALGWSEANILSFFNSRSGGGLTG
jgi:sortase A